jgi:hypothetical protein
MNAPTDIAQQQHSLSLPCGSSCQSRSWLDQHGGIGRRRAGEIGRRKTGNLQLPPQGCVMRGGAVCRGGAAAATHRQRVAIFS